MSEKQVLILLHGMGKHTADSFKKEVVTAANNALGRYESYKDVDFSTGAHIHSIDYDHLFENLRKKMAESGESLQSFITTELGGVNLPRFFDDLVEIESGLGADEFIYTHVLDVIFYLTLLGEKVRLYVAEEILKIKAEYPTTTRVNILAHSLGTAVIHDTLNKLFTTGPTSDTQINIDEHKLTSLWSIANVSRIITTFSGLTDPLDSLVKPGKGGCLVRFNNAYHRFDPFTLKPFKRFDPDNTNQWLESDAFQYRYKRFKTEKVSRLNTHSIEGYLEDPVICHDFLNQFLEFRPSEEEKSKGDAEFKNEQDLREDIIDFVTEIDTAENLITFIKMIKKYLKFINELDD